MTWSKKQKSKTFLLFENWN